MSPGNVCERRHDAAEPARRPPNRPVRSDLDAATHRFRRRVIYLGLLTVLIGGLALSVPGLGDLGDRLSDVDPGWVVAAIGLEVLSGLSFVLVFRLVFPRVPHRLGNRVAWSEQAFGALLPTGGAGGLAIGAWILRAAGHPLRTIVRDSGVLFLLTSLVNFAALVVFGVAQAVGAGSATALALAAVPAAVGFLLIAGIAALARVESISGAGRIRRWLAALAPVSRDTLALLRARDWRLLGAVGYLAFDIAVLWIALRAFGLTPSLPAMVLAYLVGYLSNWIPIPGGLGVLDGGLVAALLLYGMPAAPVAAAVVLYHAVALWIPTLVGTWSFAALRRAEPALLSPSRRAADRAPALPRPRGDRPGSRAGIAATGPGSRAGTPR